MRGLEKCMGKLPDFAFVISKFLDQAIRIGEVRELGSFKCEQDIEKRNTSGRTFLNMRNNLKRSKKDSFIMCILLSTNKGTD